MKQGNSSISDFTSKFKAAAMFLPGFGDEAFLTHFFLGLSPKVQAFVKSLPIMPETFKDMVNICLEFGSRADFGTTSPVSFLSDPNAMEIDTLEAKGIEPTERNARRRFRIENNLCAYCGGKGHFRNNCPIILKHQNKSRDFSNYVEPFIAVTESNQYQDKKSAMFLEIVLSWSGGSCNTLAYVDSGASGGTFIAQELVSRYSIPTDSAPLFSVSGFTGKNSTTTSSVTLPLKLSIGNHTEGMQFRVLESCRHSVILGYDWLFQHNLIIDWKTPSLTFSRCLCNGLPSSVPVIGEPLNRASPESSAKVILPQAAIRLDSTTEQDDLSEDEADDEETIRSLLPVQYSSFSDVFSEKAANLLPDHRPFDCSIELKDPSMIPPFRPIYSLSPQENTALELYIDENLKKGYIRPSRSPSGAPIFFVPKKSKELRPCVDYRGLNDMTIKNSGAIPLIKDLLDRLGSAKYFSKIDLRGAYNLVRIKPGDEWKTAFRCHRGHFEYRVMPFGLTNAPAIFQGMMNSIFSDLLDIFVIVYLDDILVFSDDITNHRNHVSLVLSRLRDNCLYAKLSKCAFDQNSVEFLGHIVSPAGISPLPEKISSITTWPVPENLKQVQSFLGLSNYYRRFISNYSKVALPLTQLTKKNVPFVWNDMCQLAFNALKQSLSTGPVLRHVDPGLPFTLETDASNFAIGAVLCQPAGFDCSDLHPIAFYSRKLDSAESNYDVHDKELLAIICALEHWRQHLVGSPFLVQVLCDHRNLTFFQNRRILSPRHARWVNRLSPFQFSLAYRSGSSNIAADALSRRIDYSPQEGSNFNEPLDSAKASILLPQKLFVDSIQLSQRKLVENKEEGMAIIQARHDGPAAGHLGRSKTFELVSRDFYWKGMRKDVYDFVDGCDTCQRNKSPRHKPFGLLQPLPIPTRPWSSISMDFIVKLPLSQGFGSILVIVCRLTKQAHFIACRESTNSSQLADIFINQVFRYHGLPDDIISDRGPQFRSNFWQALLKKLNIDSKLSTAYHPQTDGQTERVNQSLEQYLRCFVCYAQNDWASYLAFAEFALNNSESSSTKQSPFFANYGFHPRMDYLNDSSSHVPAANNYLNNLKDLSVPRFRLPSPSRNS